MDLILEAHSTENTPKIILYVYCFQTTDNDNDNKKM